MTGIAIQAFRGTKPRTSKRLIGDSLAQQALNCRITSGRLDPIKGLGLVHTSLAAQIETIYRYRFRTDDNWLVWDTTVDVAKSPVAQDSLGRFYFSGDGEPRMSTYADAISGGGPYPTAWYVLGVVSPVSAMAITVVGGTGANEDRGYVYTFRNRYGEESGPSPATLKTGKVDGSWNITGMDAAPPNSGTVSAAVKDTPLIGQVQVTLNSVFGLAGSEEVVFSAVTGMTDLNGKFKLESVDPATNKVVVSLSTSQTYVSGGTWARRAPHNLASMTKCIYRTIGTNTDYKLVAEIPAANTTYNDTNPSTTVSLNAGISTLDTLPPLKNAHSLVLLANGVMAALAENQLCLSEQGKPYSWPVSNRYSFPGIGIALVAAGNSVIVLTDNFPYVATASVPEAASLTKIPGETLAPCVSKRGVVDIGSGAIYPSHDGLFVVTTAGARNLTAELFDFEDWQKLKPESFKAGFQGGTYYAMHDTDSQGYVFSLNTKEPDSVVEFNLQVDTLYANPLDGRLYAGQANKISLWDGDDTKRMTAYWTSKEYQLGRSLNFSVAQVHAKFEDLKAVDNTILDANTALLADINKVGGAIGCSAIGVNAIAGSKLKPIPDVTAPSIQFTLIVEDTPVFTKEVTSSAPFRLPGDFKSDLQAAQIATTVPVYSINIAQGMQELKQAAA
jgi:hypothetical protein